mgnify:CR=1 FL=1
MFLINNDYLSDYEDVAADSCRVASRKDMTPKRIEGYLFWLAEDIGYHRDLELLRRFAAALKGHVNARQRRAIWLRLLKLTDESPENDK